jgi:hypothetical protein
MKLPDIDDGLHSRSAELKVDASLTGVRELFKIDLPDAVQLHLTQKL